MHALFDQRRYLIPFRATLLPQIFTDVLVIGAGVAGLRAAISVAEESKGAADVIVTAKGKLKESNTYWAQGGVAAVLPDAGSDEDCFTSHVKDTMVAGADLCDLPIVKLIVENAPKRIAELVQWGMPFDHVLDGSDHETSRLAVGREGGHSFARILHSDGDATGKRLQMTLEARARACEHVRIFDQCFVLDLITVEGSTPRCVGAITHHPRYGLQVIWAASTILASGGAGQVYRESTNPNVATGDGLAMAYRAGAQVADLAFMQFHPTTFYVAGASRSLITEAVRGEGGRLIDHTGEAFMPKYHELADLAPRDIVSRAILQQMADTNASHVYLDCRHFEPGLFARRFPSIHKHLIDFGVDPEKAPIPIHPSAHYMVGGVWTDEHARSSVQGLYAAGEASCTGLHGANRLASNSLLEGLVMGEVAGRTALELVEAGKSPVPSKIVSDIRLSERSELDLADVRSSLRSVMWRHVGINRQGERLAEVAEMIDFWARYNLDKIFDERAGWEVQNLLLIGALMTRSAMWRRESRGTHYRIDHPLPDEDFKVHDLWQRGSHQPKLTPALGA
ncbi:MAG: L-aspartate oxidase [Phycisphaera sp.]|nr:L-aspartate oxidase [Phycisphaera sp.]